MDHKDWLPDEAIENLTVRRALSKVEDSISLSNELFKENLPMSVMSICHLAVYSPIEAIRFQAAKYVVDRTMGDKGSMPDVDSKPAWERIYEGVLVEADKIVGNGKYNDQDFGL